jgi:signal transduction histidine kinase
MQWQGMCMEIYRFFADGPRRSVNGFVLCISLFGTRTASTTETAGRVLSGPVILLLAVLAVNLSADTALAAETRISFISAMMASPAEIILLAVFSGAMSFAIMSAFWLVRERTRIVGKNRILNRELAELRARNEQLKALVNVADQRIAVWSNGDEQQPALLGQLSRSSGAPDDRKDFVAFGRWLTPDIAVSFESALRRLRTKAEAFDLPLITRSGGVIEAQGRISGGCAFVRFVELSGKRSSLSRLEAEYARLNATFDSIQCLFEALPGPVWLRDRTGKLFWVNSAYALAVDCADSDAVVERNVELLDSAQRREIGRTHGDGEDFRGTVPTVIAGDRRLMEICEIICSAGGAGIAIDRHETHVIGERLDQTLATHAQTLDYLATAVAMFDSRQQLQFYNSSFQQLWKLDEAFLAGHPTNAQLLDAMRAENRLPEFPDWRKWRESQLEVYQALEAREDWWYLPGGETLRVVVNPHSQGGATWVFENVTEKLELQTNYNSLIRIQGETLENLNEAVAVFGTDGRLRLCNPVFSGIWQLDKAETGTGLHIMSIAERCRDKLADPEQWEKIAEAITGYDDERDDLDGRLETREGTVLDFSLVRLPEGQTMLALTDVTASVNVERALKERNEALEQSDRLKNRFLQHVSYELRAPLTSISGFAEMMTMPQIGRLNHKQEEYIGHISKSADTLKAIIDDILDLATIDAGAMRLDCENVKLEKAIAECAAILANEMEIHGIRLAVDIEPDANQIEGDRQRIRQIVSNLMSNAIRFSPDGGTVSITTAMADGAVELYVCDEGPGIAEGDREIIFRRFEGRSDARGRRGAGLGLSVAKSLVELHGGDIRIETNETAGARFVCRFPRDFLARQDAA